MFSPCLGGGDVLREIWSMALIMWSKWQLCDLVDPLVNLPKLVGMKMVRVEHGVQNRIVDISARAGLLGQLSIDQPPKRALCSQSTASYEQCIGIGARTAGRSTVT
jgi:hypothetical protein